MRYERKYRIEGLPVQWIEQVIRFHPAGFRPLYPERQVNNIYFDSPALDEFYQNIAGAPQRRKHRLRWYGEQYTKLHDPVFEIKIKDNELGRKETQALESTTWSDLKTSFLKVTTLNYLPLRPVLVNSYDRNYWISSNGRFRITLDWNLSFSAFSWATLQKHLFLPDQAVVLELKYEEENDSEAQDIFSHIPFRLSKNSKYVTGINLVMGGN